ncbi:hypothetical protein FRC03_002849 [Tulasnella sp. 419]|nr:hypothetical protein FRC03_002849 [Tulasnella sp. 419]
MSGIPDRRLGTNSAPLEITTSAKPMGTTDKSGGVSQGVKDADRRQAYLNSGSTTEKDSVTTGSDLSNASKRADESVERSNARVARNEDGMQKY